MFGVYVILKIFFSVVSKGVGFLFWSVARLLEALCHLKGNIIKILFID